MTGRMLLSYLITGILSGGVVFSSLTDVEPSFLALQVAILVIYILVNVTLLVEYGLRGKP